MYAWSETGNSFFVLRRVKFNHGNGPTFDGKSLNVEVTALHTESFTSVSNMVSTSSIRENEKPL